MSTELWNDELDRPLQHVRVLDMSVMLPGPLLTRLLAQYGAEVVKIESLPQGDHLRREGFDALFELANKGKRSIALDLKQSAANEIIKQLVGEADVFVENFRNGVADSLGLGYADLSEVNPDLIYLSIRGFSGKNASRAGHDMNFIANSGVGEWFLENGVPNQSTQFGDMVGGTLVPAIRLLLQLCNPTRRGMHLVCHMDEGFRILYLGRAIETTSAANSPQNKTLHYQMSGDLPHSRYYRCRDDQWIALNAIQEKHWKTFCDIVDKPEWVNRKEDPGLCKEIEKMFKDAPASYWEALAGQKDGCFFKVTPWNEHVNYSQAAAQLKGDPFTWCGFSPNLSLGPAPQLGADTFAVLSSMGFDNKQIADWAAKGAIDVAVPS